MCILRLRFLNLRSPHSFSKIDCWENAVTGVLCVEKEELREDSFFCASLHFGASYKCFACCCKVLRSTKPIMTLPLTSIINVRLGIVHISILLTIIGMMWGR